MIEHHRQLWTRYHVGEDANIVSELHVLFAIGIQPGIQFNSNFPDPHPLSYHVPLPLFHNITTLPPRLTKRNTKLPKVALGCLLNILLHHPPILLLILHLHFVQMHAVPMQPYEARGKQLHALLAFVLAGRSVAAGRGRRGLDKVHERVVQEHGIAGGAVDDAVEDVSYDFALRSLYQWINVVIWKAKLTTRLLLLRRASRAKLPWYFCS